MFKTLLKLWYYSDIILTSSRRVFMLYKDLMTKDTYNDLQDYLELGWDMIDLEA